MNKDALASKAVRASAITVLLLCICMTAWAGMPAAGYAPTAPPGWVVETVDGGQEHQDMTDRSMRLDSEDQPHYAYGGKHPQYDLGGNHLFYAWFDGQVSHYEVADGAPDVGSHAALDLDSGDRPHISYHDEGNSRLKYAWLDGNGWHTRTIDNDGDVGEFTSITLDDGGRPHISYYDRGKGDLKYAFRDGGGWHIRTVDSGGDVGRYTSLALDPDGYPHISYYDKSQGALRHAYRDTGGWHTANVDDGGTVGKYTSIALDGDGYPHISYYDVGRENLRYAHKDPDGWHSEPVDTEGRVGLHTSLAIDGEGVPHISYAAEEVEGWQEVDRLKYAHKGAAGWETGTVTVEWLVHPREERYTALDLDSAGQPHIGSPGYRWTAFDWEAPCLIYSHREGGAWHSRILFSFGGGDNGIDLTVDEMGHPHASYHGGQEDLKYAYRDTHGWHVQVLELIGECDDVTSGRETSLALDSLGYPHIGYRTECWIRQAKYAYMDAAGWHFLTFSEWSSVPYLALDSDDYPHIIYVTEYEPPTHAYRDAGGWHYEPIDVYGPLALDGDDYLHVAWGDGGALKYAYQDADGWHFETADPDGNPQALVLDDAGSPHIGYESDGTCKYAYRDASGWHTTPVDTPERWHCDLAVDSGRFPHFAYNFAYQDAWATVYYRYQDTGGWQEIESFDAGFLVPEHDLAIALDSADSPFIAFKGGYDFVVARKIAAQAGKLEVVKDLIPEDDAGRFHLQIDGTTEKWSASDGDSTGEVEVSVGSHEVGEVAAPGTDLGDYEVSIECRKDGGSGNVVASGDGPGPLNVPVGAGEDVVCTITNERGAPATGTLEVVKELVPGGDPGRFHLQIDSATEEWSAGDGDSTGKVRIPVGTHDVREVAAPGTDLDDYGTAIECRAEGGSGAIVASGDGPGPLDVPVGAEQDVVCTIQNSRLTGPADLAISKSATPATAGRGQPISYTLTFSNTGGSVASSATISDRVPAELRGISFSSSWPMTPTGIFSYTWALGDLDPGAGGWIHLYGTVRGDLGAGFSFTNTACIDSPVADANPGDNCDSVAVAVVNSAPVALDDGYTTRQDAPLSTAPQSVLDNDSDAEGDALIATLESGTESGALALSLDGTFVYSPTLGFSGQDAFTYRASDGLLASNVATATVTVTPVYYLYLPLVVREH